MKTLQKPIVRRVGEEPASWYFQNRLTYLANPTETDNEYGLFHALIAEDGMPPAHVHAREDEVFYILRGRMKVLVANHQYVAGPGDLVYLPRGLAHAPIPLDPEVEALVFIVPGDMLSMFKQFSRPASRPGLPTKEEVQVPDLAVILEEASKRELTMLPPASSPAIWFMPEIHADPKLVPAGSGRKLQVLNSAIDVKLDAADTQGLISIFEIADAPGAGAPTHIHRRDSEAFYVLEGEYEVEIEGITQTAGPGSFVYVPKDIARAYRNVGAATGRMLVISAKSGHEEFFADIDRLAEFDMGKLIAIGAKHGVELVGP